MSRAHLQKLLKDGGVTVNDRPVKSSYKVAEGDKIQLDIPEAVEPEIVPEEMDLDILYEDKDIILINKPKGMVVHPAPGHTSGSCCFYIEDGSNPILLSGNNSFR